MFHPSPPPDNNALPFPRPRNPGENSGNEPSSTDEGSAPKCRFFPDFPQGRRLIRFPLLPLSLGERPPGIPILDEKISACFPFGEKRLRPPILPSTLSTPFRPIFSVSEAEGEIEPRPFPTRFPKPLHQQFQCKKALSTREAPFQHNTTKRRTVYLQKSRVPKTLKSRRKRERKPQSRGRWAITGPLRPAAHNLPKRGLKTSSRFAAYDGSASSHRSAVTSVYSPSSISSSRTPAVPALPGRPSPVRLGSCFRFPFVGIIDPL